MNTKERTSIVEVNGALGGGQILRSALTLSMITGRPFKIVNIRSTRSKPGLMRQHLTAVRAAQCISNAKVHGAELGTKELIFIPGTIESGDYSFAIGTAGSTALVAQTLIPALLFGQQHSTITITGGTHCAMAPSIDFLQQAYCPALQKMGMNVSIELIGHGFFPAGGGEIKVSVDPLGQAKAFDCITRGDIRTVSTQAIIAHIPFSIAQRELKAVQKALALDDTMLSTRQVNSHSPGNCIQITIESDEISEHIFALGEKKLSAEKVAQQAARQAKRYINSQVAISQYLADQLLLPMAIGAGGQFSTLEPTAHALSQSDLIQTFMLCTITMKENTVVDAPHAWLVEVGSVI